LSLELTILGSGSAVPYLTRNHTAQFLYFQEKGFLIDCGEGTQLQIQKYKVKPNKIDYILISHLHGDHYLGLMGLLSSLSLLGRKKSLEIFAPVGLREIIQIQLKYSASYINFPLTIHELKSTKQELIIENDHLEVYTIPLTHSTYCNGFLFREKEKPFSLLMDKIPGYFSHEQLKTLKQGISVYDKYGELLLDYTTCTIAPKKSISFAFCSDSVANDLLIPYLKNIDIVYHECSFCSKHAHTAERTSHSYTHQVGNLAKESNIKLLIVGHFSGRYKDPSELLEEIKLIFPQTIEAIDGLKISWNELKEVFQLSI